MGRLRSFLLAAAAGLVAGALTFLSVARWGRSVGDWIGLKPDDPTLITTAAAMAGGIGLAAYRAVKRLLPKPITTIRSGRIPDLAEAFQNRPAEMDALRRVLKGSGHTAALVAVAGMQGVGKSQLAAAYAHHCIGSKYALVAWIDAETSLVSGLAQLGTALGVPSHLTDTDEARAEAACNALESLGGRRLVTFDNATEPDELAKYLPSSGHVEVVITTNNLLFDKQLDRVSTVPVGLFSPAQGIAYLTETTQITDDVNAQRVGDELGWLPLALAQAASVIRDPVIGYSRYVEMLNAKPARDALSSIAGHRYGVVRATMLAIETAARKDPSGLAERLFAFLCMLSPEGIDIALIESPEAVVALGADKVDVRPALVHLADASLLSRGTTDTTSAAPVWMVHRLTARNVRENKPALQHDAAVVAGAALKAATDQLPEYAVSLRRNELNSLVGHIQSLRRNTPDVTLQVLTLMTWAGSRLRAFGDLGRAVPILEQTVRDYGRVHGAHPLDELTCRRELGEAQRRAGKIAEAIATFEQALADRQRLLGPLHEDTLRSQQDLAGTYRNEGRFDEAIALYEQTLADMERVLDPGHTDTVRSRHDLAYAYRSAGLYDMAIPLFNRAILEYQRTVGADDRDAMRASDNLATTYRDSGRLDEAVALYRETIARRTRVLGPDHQDTLESRNSLATAYRIAGHYDLAIDLHSEVLADRLRVLGPDHLDTHSSRHDLANAYLDADRVREAIPLYEESLAGYTRAPNPVSVYGCDPHSYPRQSLDGVTQAADWLQPSGFIRPVPDCRGRAAVLLERIHRAGALARDPRSSR